MAIISISEDQLASLLEISATKAVERFCFVTGVKYKDLISKRQAENMYGATNIYNLDRDNKITPIRRGTANCMILYSQTEIITALGNKEIIARIDSKIHNHKNK